MPCLSRNDFKALDCGNRDALNRIDASSHHPPATEASHSELDNESESIENPHNMIQGTHFFPFKCFFRSKFISTLRCPCSEGNFYYSPQGAGSQAAQWWTTFAGSDEEYKPVFNPSPSGMTACLVCDVFDML